MKHKTTKRKILAMLYLPLGLMGVSRISVSALFLFYAIVYLKNHDVFFWEKMLSFDAVYFELLTFNALAILSELVCNVVAKHLLHEKIDGIKIYSFSGFVLVVNIACCLMYGWVNSHSATIADTSGADIFYIRLIVYLLVTTFVVVKTCGFIFKQINEEKMNLLEELKSEREQTVQAQLKMLKLQLDPHFMFNSLATLSGLVSENPQEAQNFVARLAHIYRYIVAHVDENMVSIDDAVAFIRNYCSHLEMRYKDNFRFEIDDNLCDNEGEMILPLSLQLLVENAVKHNRHSAENPLKVRIYRDADFVCVSNRIVPYSNDTEHRGESMQIGTKNLFDRYKLLTNKLPIILQTETDYIVKLPVIAENKSDILQ